MLFYTKLQAFWTNAKARLEAEDGVTAIEYGLIAALIAVVIIGALQLVGTSLTTIFGEVSSALGGASDG